MRTPVASKNALAIAAGTGTRPGSPEPVDRDPPAATDVVSVIGTSVRWSASSVIFGASLKRIIG